MTPLISWPGCAAGSFLPQLAKLLAWRRAFGQNLRVEGEGLDSRGEGRQLALAAIALVAGLPELAMRIVRSGALANELANLLHVKSTDLSRSGLLVSTTLDLPLQNKILKIAQGHIAELAAATWISADGAPDTVPFRALTARTGYEGFAQASRAVSCDAVAKILDGIFIRKQKRSSQH